MEDEKHIRVPIRHTSPHKSTVLFFSSSPAYPTSHCTLWPNMHDVEENKEESGSERERERRQTDRGLEWACEWHPSPPFLSALRIPLNFRGQMISTGGLAITSASGVAERPGPASLRPVPARAPLLSATLPRQLIQLPPPLYAIRAEQ